MHCSKVKEIISNLIAFSLHLNCYLLMQLLVWSPKKKITKTIILNSLLVISKGISSVATIAKS